MNGKYNRADLRRTAHMALRLTRMPCNAFLRPERVISLPTVQKRFTGHFRESQGYARGITGNIRAHICKVPGISGKIPS